MIIVSIYKNPKKVTKITLKINIFPHHFSSVPKKTFYIFSVPAKILTITPHSAYVRGSHVELVCSVEGNPPPYVAWINATGSVLQNKTVSSTVNTNYIIQSVSSINIGTYRCETRNKYGNDSKETTITDVFGEYCTCMIGIASIKYAKESQI